MQTMKFFLLAAVAVGAVTGLGAAYRADDVKDIETVMEKAHKGDPSLFKQVVSGKASKDDQKELLALYIDLSKNKPPKGSEAEWKKKTGALVAAVKDVIAEKPSGPKALAAAANCKACHTIFKPD